MTIEERAYNYADSIYKGKKDIEWDIARAGYKFGSQDQQKIDINKACKWLENEFMFGCRVNDGRDLVKRFRKAMKGGIG